MSKSTLLGRKNPGPWSGPSASQVPLAGPLDTRGPAKSFKQRPHASPLKALSLPATAGLLDEKSKGSLTGLMAARGEDRGLAARRGLENPLTRLEQLAELYKAVHNFERTKNKESAHALAQGLDALIKRHSDPLASRAVGLKNALGKTKKEGFNCSSLLSHDEVSSAFRELKSATNARLHSKLKECLDEFLTKWKVDSRHAFPAQINKALWALSPDRSGHPLNALEQKAGKVWRALHVYRPQDHTQAAKIQRFTLGVTKQEKEAAQRFGKALRDLQKHLANLINAA